MPRPLETSLSRREPDYTRAGYLEAGAVHRLHVCVLARPASYNPGPAWRKAPFPVLVHMS